MDEAKLMTTKEVAAYLDVAVSTLLLYRSDGTGPRYLKMGRLVRYVFHSPLDPAKPIVDLRKAFWWALDYAGLPKMRIHDLRHSFASFAASMGENLNHIKDVLGHTRITTTEIYAHTSGDGAKRTANNVADAIMG